METTQVLVVGAGPCGMTVANLLGLYGVATIVVDREPDVVDYPRAVGIDDESLRTCQTFGLVDDVLADTLQNVPIRYYTSWGRCFAHVEPSARPFGWARRNLFLQPLLERTLRNGVSRFASIDVRLEHELIGLEQLEDGVEATIRGREDDDVRIRAKFLVGADGGRSTVRDLIDVPLEGTTEPVKWLVVDVANDELDAPYAAVYCDDDSPVLMVPLPYRHRRFEFRLSAADDETMVVRPDHVRVLLAARYGSVPLPDVVRTRVYLHHSRVASRFVVGSVLLAGDAAHLQPPFFGQGMNSGLRDATNLAWKLAAVLRGLADAGVVNTYDVERRPHASAMVAFATRIGAMYRPRNRFTERARDLVFRAVQLIPGGRDYILQMKYKPMPRYTQGVLVGVVPRDKHDPIGRMFPQPHVGLGGRRVLLDEALGSWFAILCLVVDPAALDGDSLAWWRQVGARILAVRDRSRDSPADTDDDDDFVSLDDVDGTLHAWSQSHPDAEVIVLRPDRYVAAACRSVDFAAATATLRDVLGGGA